MPPDRKASGIGAPAIARRRTTMGSMTAEADTDAALVVHFFGTKRLSTKPPACPPTRRRCGPGSPPSRPPRGARPWPGSGLALVREPDYRDAVAGRFRRAPAAGGLRLIVGS